MALSYGDNDRNGGPSSGQSASIQPINEGRPQTIGATALALEVAPPSVASEAELVAAKYSEWREALVESIDTSGLADVKSLSGAILELTKAHPAGLVQLLSGRRTKLSSLFRSPDTLDYAAGKSATVIQQLDSLADVYGTATAALAVGVATWAEPTTDAAIATPAEAHVSQDEDQDIAALATAVSADGDSESKDSAAPKAAEGKAASPHNSRGYGKKTIQMPILLHAVVIKQNEAGEYEVQLVGKPTVNPVLAKALRRKGALLDPITLAETANSSSGFRTDEVLDRIAALGEAVIPNFGLLRRTIIGVFLHPNHGLITDFDALAPQISSNTLVRALAGNSNCLDALAQAEIPTLPAELPPYQEKGIGDLDHQHQVALAAARTGANWFIAAPLEAQPGKLAAALAAEAAAAARSVVYVTGLRRSAQSFTQTLQAAALDTMVLEIPPHANWRDEVKSQLLAAMSPETTSLPGNPALRDALIGVRTQLSGYAAALHRKHLPWGVSPYDALQVLAGLTTGTDRPATNIRLAPQVLQGLTAKLRKVCTQDLVQAAALGAFRAATMLSPWYGAAVANRTEASIALERVRRLVDENFPKLIQQAAELSQFTGLRATQTMRELDSQLKMLRDVRATLDTFKPTVFQQSVAELIPATMRPLKQRRASDGAAPGLLATHKLRKQAKGHVRPGIKVANLSECLRQVEELREVWASYADGTVSSELHGWPVLPVGLSELEETYDAVLSDLKALDPIIAATPLLADQRKGLLDIEFGELLDKLVALATEGDTLKGLPEREAALARLRGFGLDDFITDLITRETKADSVGAELELAWWGSVFELMVESDPALAVYDGQGLADLLARFTELDKSHVASLALPVRQRVQALAQQASVAAATSADGHETPAAEALFSTLVSGEFDNYRQLLEQFGVLPSKLRPVMVSTPALVPQLLPPAPSVDLVLLEGIEHVPLEHLVSTLLRARQVIVIADSQLATGTAVPSLEAALPKVTIVPEPSRRDPAITQLLADNGYGRLAQPAVMPRASTSLAFEHVSGRGLVDEDSGLVDSTKEELGAVVGLVLNHARTRGQESLAVITLTAKHAKAIRAALAKAVRNDPSLAAYLSAQNPEPVVVAVADEVAQLRRDAMIFTLGLGRTPHGRVTHNFGPISGEQGVQLLNGVLTVARKRVQVVSCLRAADFDKARLAPGGPTYLYELLATAEAQTGKAWNLAAYQRSRQTKIADYVLFDIARRLRDLGCTVEFGYGCVSGTRIPLAVGHTDLPAEMLVAVLVDDAAYANQANLRDRDRRRAEQLTSLGWSVTQLFSVAAFLDPVGETQRIYGLVMAALAKRHSAGADTAPVPVVNAGA